MYKCDIIVCICCHPPCGGCGLKCVMQKHREGMFTGSPSVWRVWIEIIPGKHGSDVERSPSVWRVWIEIAAHI